MKAWVLTELVFALTQVWGASIVVPTGMESIEGDRSAIPLFGGDVGRTQFIYSSQNFSLFQPEGVYLVELRFRIEGGLNSFSGSADLELRMSTSGSNPELLDSLFSANVGADETVVLPRSTISLSGTQTSPNGPNAFNVVIPLPNHFLYKPNNGNLLVDAFVYDSSGLRNLDWSSNTSDGASAARGGLPTSQVASIRDAAAPVLQLVYVSVPEPGLYTLVGIGALIIGWRRNVST